MKNVKEEILDLQMTEELELPAIKNPADIKEILETGEELLWQGQPASGQRQKIDPIVFWRNSVLALLFICSGFSLLFWLGGNEITLQYFLVSIGVFFVLIFLISILGLPILAALRFLITGVLGLVLKNKPKTSRAYYFTNKRIIFRWKKRYKHIPFRHIKKIMRSVDKEGNGTIYFVLKKEYENRHLRTTGIRGQTYAAPPFEMLENVEQVMKMLETAWKEIKE